MFERFINNNSLSRKANFEAGFEKGRYDCERGYSPEFENWEEHGSIDLDPGQIDYVKGYIEGYNN